MASMVYSGAGAAGDKANNAAKIRFMEKPYHEKHERHEKEPARSRSERLPPCDVFSRSHGFLFFVSFVSFVVKSSFRDKLSA
jgi:hypothetical protein